MIKLNYWLPDEATLPIAQYENKITKIHYKLADKLDEYTGWVDWANRLDHSVVEDILAAADEIRNKCTVLVVIGIGGSYLGAKACIELLQTPFYNEHFAGMQNRPKVYFAGHHLTSQYYEALFAMLEKEEVCVCVISKSGTTLEPSVVFESFRKYMQTRYGKAGAAQRIYAITDARKGALREEADREGYKTFIVPDDIGGRYSVLTPVGLLPIAVAGIDIQELLAGAAIAERELNNPDLNTNICYQYAALRHMLQEQGRIIEIFEVYEGDLRYFTEWLKQLFGESECKDGKGIIPMSLQMSTDLHSMGQFLQQGRQVFFETVVTVENLAVDYSLEDSKAAGTMTTMHQLNRVVEESARNAHLENGTPNIRLAIDEFGPRCLGYMIYFFEKACAVSCYLTGVQPFDQPGVEAYKKNIKKAIRK